MTTLAPTGTPISDADPFDLDVLDNPLPFQEELREAGPVVRLDRLGVFGMGRYEQVHAALTDWQSFQSAAGVGLSNFRYEKPWRPPSLLLEADPPHHDAPRALLTRILGPRALRTLRNAWIDDAEDLVDEVLTRGTELDAVTDLAAAFPLRVFPDAVGIPDAGRENLLPYGDHTFNAFGPANSLVDRGISRIRDLSAWVNAQCVRDVLTEGGFGAQIWAAADRGDITHDQAPLIVRSLLTAGVDTTVNGLAAVLYAFATHPEQWRAVRANPSLARTAFDEAVRWESPVQTFFRTATRDIEIGGTVIPDGHKVLLFLGAANRDPRRWERPAAFDLARDPSGHVGFGMGIHQCVGQHVARLESEALLTALATRVESIEVDGPVHRHLNNTLRSWRSVPIRVRLA
ncbi:cytochrome P450 [Rhodococcus ruber]|uniref:cytochrome P450 n=1 Tax=Rhodococcus TaxID=1827 RepID=UPI0006614C17|nr:MULTISPECIES: cytochrome P450 [Rhodococcus]MDO2380563.1 cytochrome P450 [Rhodococcus ruber]AUM16987.1 cytochrome P450 [Rhodococcus ruber]AXY52566.1 cytochrome P450 [Rhodococcus ruber]MBD8056610.1 cytochrome P450 [Rhodococcus ruber]MBP2211900.1 cytochrome P450 [Rhodococcus ruber]